MEFKVGDIVRVKDWGKNFGVDSKWFKRYYHSLNIDWLIRYAYDDSYNFYSRQKTDNTEYKILFIDITENKILITANTPFEENKVYLINANGLELYYDPVEMTIAEIEDKLGIRNLKIIGEKG